MKYRSGLSGMVLLIAGACLPGCGASPVYYPTTGGYLGADISPKGTWSAHGSLSNAAAATDGDLSTAARSDYNYRSAAITIDLKKACLFQTVIIDHGNAEHGHCRKVALATSLDGKIFIDRYAAPGTRRITILCTPGPVLARYVRLQAVAPGPRPWSIAEVYLQ